MKLMSSSKNKLNCEIIFIFPFHSNAHLIRCDNVTRIMVTCHVLIGWTLLYNYSVRLLGRGAYNYSSSPSKIKRVENMTAAQ